MDFKNKVVAITGAGSGIGREVVLKLLQKGAKVAAIDISEEGLKETSKLSGDFAENLSLHTINITDKKAIYDFAQETVQKHGQIDAVLNVAGIIQPFVKVNDLSYEKIEQVMNVNFYGTLYMIKAFLPHLLKNEQKTIIGNVSSMGGFLPVPGQGVYGASKAAVKLMTEALYAELKNTKVAVSIIFPGAVATNITQNSGIKMDLPKPEEGKKQKEYKSLPAPKAADIIIKGLEKEKFRIIVGSDSRIMDFLYRLNPKGAVNMITKQMKDLLK